MSRLCWRRAPNADGGSGGPLDAPLVFFCVLFFCSSPWYTSGGHCPSSPPVRNHGRGCLGHGVAVQPPCRRRPKRSGGARLPDGDHLSFFFNEARNVVAWPCSGRTQGSSAPKRRDRGLKSRFGHAESAPTGARGRGAVRRPREGPTYFFSGKKAGGGRRDP